MENLTYFLITVYMLLTFVFFGVCFSFATYIVGLKIEERKKSKKE